jgi:hypothetical protein
LLQKDYWAKELKKKNKTKRSHRSINSYRSFWSFYIYIIILILLFSGIQILPFQNTFNIISQTSATSIWTETDWLTETNYSARFGIQAQKVSGDLKLFPGNGFFVSDYYNNRIVQTNMQGTYWNKLGTVGSGTNQFRYPFSLSYDNDTGFIYVSDAYNYRMVKTKIDGSGWTTYGTWGTGTGNFYSACGVDFDESTGFIYIADSNNHRIVKTKINGSGWTTLGTYGSGKGEFYFPSDVNYDETTGYLYITDSRNNRIVRTDINGTEWTVFGTQGVGQGEFNYPSQLKYDSDTCFIYILDRINHRIVKTKIDGSGWTTYGKFGTGTSSGEFYYPYGIEFDNKTGFLYIADSMNSRIVRTKMNGSGWKTYGGYGIGSGSGQFYYPLDISLCRSNYVLSGYQLSKEFDCGRPANLLNIKYTADQPTNTSVKFQIRSAPNQTALAKKPFVGPNGSMNRYYTTTGAPIWSGHDGDTCFQYKIYLHTNDPSISPTLKDVEIEYNLLPRTPILLSPVELEWTNNIRPTFTWQFRDSDSAGQSAFRIQIDDNKKFLNVDIDSNKIFTSNSSYRSLKSLTDSVWYWRVMTKDNDGGWGAFSETGEFFVDTRPPVSEIEHPFNNSYYKKLNRVTGVATDLGLSSGVNKVELCIKRLTDDLYWTGDLWDNAETWLSTDGGNKWYFDSSSVIWTSGVSYRIKTRAWDNVTNMETINSGKLIHIDTEKPVSKVESPVDNSARYELNLVKGTAFDVGGSGVKNVEITIKRTMAYTKNIENINNIDNVNNTDSVEDMKDKYWSGNKWIDSKTWLPTAGAEEWIYDSSNVLWNTGREYIITSRATDMINQLEVPSSGTSFVFDVNHPTSTVVFPAHQSYQNIIYSITGFAADLGGSGIDIVDISLKRKSDDKYWNGVKWILQETWLATKIDIDIDNHDLVRGSSPNLNTPWTFNSRDVTWTTGVYYSVITRATDRAGNHMVSTPGNIFMFDDVAPTQTFMINDGSKYTNSTNTKLMLDYSDTGSGVEFMSFSQDSENWSSWEDLVNIKSFNLSTGDSEKFVYFRVMDKAGNIGEPVFEQIILDTMPPQSSMTIADRGAYTNLKFVTLDLYAYDNFTGVWGMTFSNDMNHWSIWEPYTETKNYEITGADGLKTIYFKVRDLAGNIAIVSNIIVLDTTPPDSLKITINDGGAESNDAVVILNISAYDGLSGVGQISIRTLTQPWTDWEVFSNKKKYTLSSGNGQKIVYFRVMDKAGNIATPASASVNLNEPLPREYEDESVSNSLIFNIMILILVVILLVILFSYLYFRKRRKNPKKKSKSDNISVFSIKPQKNIGTSLNIPQLQSTIISSQDFSSKLQLPPSQTRASNYIFSASKPLAKPPEAAVIGTLPIPMAQPVAQLPPAQVGSTEPKVVDDTLSQTQEKDVEISDFYIPGLVPKSTLDRVPKASNATPMAPMAIPVDKAGEGEENN